MRTVPPKVGMKIEFPFQVAVCCWVDLLGYGAAIREADYNPLNPLARDAVSRIRIFHQIVANHSASTFPTLVMNDGACAYFDLSYRTRWPTYDFLQRAKALFDSIQEQERRDGHPGARMVIAAGFRLRGRASQRSALRGAFVKQLLKKLEEGKITPKDAVTTASKFGSPFDIVPHLQANFAFTKCYIAEQSGTQGGLPGPACYVDDALFDSGLTSDSDLGIGPKIEWKSEKYKLAANFHHLSHVRRARQTEFKGGKLTHHGPEGFRDALEIAELLTGDPNVLDALRQARKDRFGL
ncbi:MAG TPA: hypothetical protein VFP12_15225 [Allosphingosinicella sp.]|nr:hypothetical protein [Allosphingosinicella sp.]